MFIFLYGADTFRSNEKLGAFKNTFLAKNGSGSDLSIFDYSEAGTETAQFQDLLSVRGLFSTKKLLIIKNAIESQNPDQQKELLKILKKNPNAIADQDLVLIFFESTSPKKNGTLFKFLLSNSAKKQEFAPLDNFKLANWALNFLKNFAPEKTIDKRALEMLIVHTGNDLYLLGNEISKLANFKNTGEIITSADVELLVKAKVDSTVFQAIEALTAGNKARALTLLHEQIENSADVFYLLSMYTYHIRTLLKIGDCFFSGVTYPADIAQITKLHPYVIQKSLSQLRQLSQARILSLLKTLAEIDHNAKTGKEPALQALDRFIVSI